MLGVAQDTLHEFNSCAMPTGVSDSNTPVHSQIGFQLQSAEFMNTVTKQFLEVFTEQVQNKVLSIIQHSNVNTTPKTTTPSATITMADVRRAHGKADNGALAAEHAIRGALNSPFVNITDSTPSISYSPTKPSSDTGRRQSSGSTVGGSSETPRRSTTFIVPPGKVSLGDAKERDMNQTKLDK